MYICYDLSQGNFIFSFNVCLEHIACRVAGSAAECVGQLLCVKRMNMLKLLSPFGVVSVESLALGRSGLVFGADEQDRRLVS